MTATALRTSPLLLLTAIALSAACGSDDDADGGPSAGTGAGVGSGGGGAGGTSATGGVGQSGGTMSTGGMAQTGGATAPTDGGSGFSEVGVCGRRGESTVDADTFTGFEELYIIAEEGFGDDICVVRFEVTRVGDAPTGCDDPTADVDCIWTHLVEFGDPTIMTDVDGVCANSELGLDEAALSQIAGTQAAYGFVSEFAGHNSVLMKYDDAAAAWDAYGNATWDEGASAFRFDRRDGFCNY